MPIVGSRMAALQPIDAIRIDLKPGFAQQQGRWASRPRAAPPGQLNRGSKPWQTTAMTVSSE